LLAFPARFVNLQYDSNGSESELSRPLPCGRLVRWPDALDDYDRTAALVCALDIVVSVCTAVIHLAGALGRPTLVMTPFAPEWRYGEATEAMPWYPSVRLIRQKNRGDWASVIRTVHTALAELAESKLNS